MNIGVSGTRTCKDAALFEKIALKHIRHGDTIITGDATGVDAMAQAHGLRRGLVVVICRARWKEFGLKAGPIRNQEIVDRSDAFIALWDGKSRGTEDAIRRARKKGIPLGVHTYG